MMQLHLKRFYAGSLLILTKSTWLFENHILIPLINFPGIGEILRDLLPTIPNLL